MRMYDAGTISAPNARKSASLAITMIIPIQSRKLKRAKIASMVFAMFVYVAIPARH